jgi:hypothetical protein
MSRAPRVVKPKVEWAIFIEEDEMNRSQRIRAVYQELRSATAGVVPAGDLLGYADQLVGLFFDEAVPSFSLRTGGQNFDSWSIDRAMADGGWRVMNRFSSIGSDEDDESIGDPMVVQQWRDLGVEMCV